jgi:hypothetical protein
MRKIKTIPNSREWAMEIVSFARSDDATRYNLAGFNLKLNRMVATDGCRLAWQEYGPAMPDSYHGLIDEHGNAAEGEFPDYKAVLPSSPNIVFHVSSDGDWLSALETIARLHKQPLGELAHDGEQLTASFKSTSPEVMAKLTILVAAGDPKPFKLGINLAWLWDAIDGARRSDGRGRWYARVSIVDQISPVRIDNTNGYYRASPCRADAMAASLPSRNKTNRQPDSHDAALTQILDTDEHLATAQAATWPLALGQALDATDHEVGS